MTGQIAKTLGVKEVLVNFRAADLMHHSLEANPLEKLEFTKHKFNFGNMKIDERLYNSEDYFPKDIDFLEKKQMYTEPNYANPAEEKEVDYKELMFKSYPETEEAGHKRAIQLIEEMH